MELGRIFLIKSPELDPHPNKSKNHSSYVNINHIYVFTLFISMSINTYKLMIKIFKAIQTILILIMFIGFASTGNLAETYSNFWNNGFSMPAGTGNMNKDPLFANPNPDDGTVRDGINK